MRISIFLATMLLANMCYAEEIVKVYEQNCGKCHSVKYKGKMIGKGQGGPELTGLKAKRPLEFLTLYVRDPVAAQKKYPDIYNSQIKGKFTKKMKKIGESAVTDDELAQIIEMMR